MLTENMDRREALNHIFKTVALAAGISVLDLRRILSAEAGTLSKSAQTQLKMLKVQLSGFDLKVFQSQFGRITPLKPAASMGIPGATQGMGCAVHSLGGVTGANAASSCPQFSICGAFGGDSCPALDTCATNVCSGQDYGDEGGTTGGECRTNDCNGQECGNLDTCGDNECTSQSCPELSGCAKNKADITGLLNQFRNDPYVQGLMEHFHTTNTQQLGLQVQNMLRQKRFITPQQVMGGKPVQQKALNVQPKTN